MDCNGPTEIKRDCHDCPRFGECKLLITFKRDRLEKLKTYLKAEDRSCADVESALYKCKLFLVVPTGKNYNIAIQAAEVVENNHILDFYETEGI